MSGSRKIRAAIKKLLEPHLADEGFHGTYPNFQRVEGDALQILSVIHDKWGGGFVLEFAGHVQGPLQTSWGIIVPQEEITIAHIVPDKRARLVAAHSGQGRYEDFFRYEGISEDRQQCEALIGEVVERFPQVNAWLRSGVVGRNISPFAAVESIATV